MMRWAQRPGRWAVWLGAALLLAACAGCTWQDFDPPWPRWRMDEWPPEAPAEPPERPQPPEPSPPVPPAADAVEV